MSRVIGHLNFEDESLQSVALVLRTKPQQPRDRKRTKHKPMPLCYIVLDTTFLRKLFDIVTCL